MNVEKGKLESEAIESTIANPPKRSAFFKQKLWRASLTSSRTILAADTPRGIATLRNIFADSISIVPATTMEKAADALRSPIDMIVCGIHFSESRMLDLLTQAQANPSSKDVPFLAFRDLESELDPTFFKSMEVAIKVLGGLGFIDLYTLKKQRGVSDADAEFRRIVFEALR